MFMDITLSKFRRYGLYSVDGRLIPHADYMKMLGVYVAFNLSWNYVEFIRAKCARLLGFIYRTMKGCRPHVLCQTYQSLIRSNMVHHAIRLLQAGIQPLVITLLKCKEFKIEPLDCSMVGPVALNLILILCLLINT
jgi:hypothetical protein